MAIGQEFFKSNLSLNYFTLLKYFVTSGIIKFPLINLRVFVKLKKYTHLRPLKTTVDDIFTPSAPSLQSLIPELNQYY